MNSAADSRSASAAPPGVVGHFGGAPHGAVEHQGRYALGMGGREEDAHRATLGDPEEGRPLRAGGVHDRPDVVDPQLQGRRLGDGIGQPGAALVEDDQSRERGEPLEEASLRGRLPLELEVGGEAEDEDEVDRPIADDLVGIEASPDLAYRVSGELSAILSRIVSGPHLVVSPL